MCIFCEVRDLSEGATPDINLTDDQVIDAERCAAFAASSGRSKVSSVTGFLGSGKTTFVNFMHACQEKTADGGLLVFARALCKTSLEILRSMIIYKK